MNIYIFHSKLFSSPRIIVSDYPVDIAGLTALVNIDNNYSDENKWILQDIPLYPKVDWDRY